MKLMHAGFVAALAAFGGLLLVAGRSGADAEPGESEVTKKPALLVSPFVKMGEVVVRGVKLGDSTDKLANNAAFTRHDVPERPQDVVFTRGDTWFFGTEGKIYRIKAGRETVRQLPAYDAPRLQMALGKADEVIENPAGEERVLSYFGRHVRYTVHALGALSVVTEVDLYAP